MEILITFIAIFLMTSIILIWGHKETKKREKREREEEEEFRRKREEKEEKLKRIREEFKIKIAEELKAKKELYQETGKPILLSDAKIDIKQTRTTQKSTGALVYSLPKEYRLHITLENISDKKIEAIEIDVLLINAFHETISSFPVSKRVSLIPGKMERYGWSLDNLPDIDNIITNLKRVLFTGGTFWINKN